MSGKLLLDQIRRTAIMAQPLGQKPKPYQLEASKPLIESLKLFQGAVEQADAHLVLDRSVVNTAVHLSHSKPSHLVDMLDMAMAPWKSFWVEWSCKDRETASAQFPQDADCDAELAQKEREVRPNYADIPLIPERTGFLVRCLDPADPARFTIHWAWTRPGFQAEFAAVCVNMGDKPDNVVTLDARGADWRSRVGHVFGLSRPSEKEVSAAGELAYRMTASPCPFLAPMRKAMDEDFGPEAVRNLVMEGTRDVSNERLFALAVILLLNTGNGTRSEPVDIRDWNRRRRGTGLPPVMPHSRLYMRLSKRERDEEGEGHSPDGAHRSPIGHVCKGHLKRVLRRNPDDPEGPLIPRLVWWRMHWRGSGQENEAGAPRVKTVVA